MTVTNNIGFHLPEDKIVGKPVTLFQGEESPVIGKVIAYDPTTGQATMEINEEEFKKLPWKNFLGISHRKVNEP